MYTTTLLKPTSDTTVPKHLTAQSSYLACKRQIQDFMNLDKRHQAANAIHKVSSNVYFVFSNLQFLSGNCMKTRKNLA